MTLCSMIGVESVQKELKHKDITHQIIGCAYQVYKKLGFGFLESVYKKAMVIELSKINLKVEQEKPLKVYYRKRINKLDEYLSILNKLQIYSFEEFLANPERYGSAERFLHLAIEAIIDMANHIIADFRFDFFETHILLLSS